MKLIQKSGLFVAAAMLAFACGKPGDTVETTDAQDVAAGSGMTLSISSETSSVNWTGYKPTGKHFGIIPVVAGEVMVEGSELTGARFTFDITGLRIDDIPADNENYGKLWGHLQSADFFDAANFPEAVFELTSVEPFSAGSIEDKDEFVTDNTPALNSELAGNPTHWISGNLTMRGTTKNIKFPATVTIADGTVSAKAGFNIDRTAWGLAYGDESNAVDKAKDQFIYNTVSVGFDIKAN